MGKTIIILSAISILYYSCTRNMSTPQVTPNDSLRTAPPPKDSLGTGWKRIQVVDTSFFEAICFINNTGFTLGDRLFKSSDGGDTWSPLSLPNGVDPTKLVNMSMGSEMNAIFVGTQFQLVSTRDGGSSFTLSTVADGNLADVFFVDSVTAYGVGTNVWKTIDAGSNWSEIHSFGGAGYYYSCVNFINPQTGWYLSGGSGLSKTADAGNTWQSVTTPFTNSQNQQVFFVNADTGYVSTGPYIERTMDGGITWTQVFSGQGAATSFRDIYFVSNTTGYITDATHIYKTVDGGNTWNRVVSLLTDQLIALHFTDSTHGWACGTKGTILKYAP